MLHRRFTGDLVFALLASLAAAPAAAAIGGLKLERADVSAYPLLKLYLT